MAIMCIFLFYFYGALSVSESLRSRRSDDVSMGALVVLVQEQSALIQSLQAKVTALETTVSDLRSRLSTAETRLGRVQQTVAFTAVLHGTSNEDMILHIGDSVAIKYNSVTTNMGNSYDPGTGTFTASVAGLYGFALSVEADNVHDSITVMIMKIANGQESALAYTLVEGAGTDHFDTSSIFVMTHLAPGEKVFVRRAWGGNYLRNWIKNSFSGFLVSAD